MSEKQSDFNIIRSPVITEKATRERMNYNKYVFNVNPRANKQQIKKAVENLFQVTVVSVRTVKSPAKPKRLGRFEGHRPAGKKALVTLKDGDRIKQMEGP